MSDEERLPILKGVLPHLTDCELSTDKGCLSYRQLLRGVFCPVKVGPCNRCCPEHQCDGATVPPRSGAERLSDGTPIRRIAVGHDALAGGEVDPPSNPFRGAFDRARESYMQTRDEDGL